MAFSRLNGIVVHWSALGPVDRPAIVFSNSLGTDWRIWDRTAELLADRYRIVTYDKRGHGLTESPPGPYSIAMLADDVLALADALSLKSFAMVGVSVGGLIAQEVALRTPQRLSALVLCDTAAKIGTTDSWNARIKAVETTGLASIADALMQRWFSRTFRDTRKAELAGWRNMLVRTPADGYAAVCAALRDADLTAGVAGIRLPTLAVAGEEDGSLPPDLSRATANLIAGARFEIIDGVGHLPCIEQPERMAGLISEHLKEAGYV